MIYKRSLLAVFGALSPKLKKKELRLNFSFNVVDFGELNFKHGNTRIQFCDSSRHANDLI